MYSTQFYMIEMKTSLSSQSIPEKLNPHAFGPRYPPQLGCRDVTPISAIEHSHGRWKPSKECRGPIKGGKNMGKPRIQTVSLLSKFRFVMFWISLILAKPFCLIELISIEPLSCRPFITELWVRTVPRGLLPLAWLGGLEISIATGFRAHWA